MYDLEGLTSLRVPDSLLTATMAQMRICRQQNAPIHTPSALPQVGNTYEPQVRDVRYISMKMQVRMNCTEKTIAQISEYTVCDASVNGNHHITVSVPATLNYSLHWTRDRYGVWFHFAAEASLKSLINEHFHITLTIT